MTNGARLSCAVSLVVSCALDASVTAQTLLTKDGFFANPGIVGIVHRKEDEAYIDDLLRSYGVEARGLTIESSVDGRETKRIIDCWVGAGHEQLWIEILRRSPYVIDATLTALELVSNSRELGGLGFRNQAPTTSVSSSRNRSAILDGIETFYAERFQSKADVSVVGRFSAAIVVVVDGMKDEVLKGSHYWEKLKLQTVVVPVDDSFVVYITLDGYYAPGVGSARPVAERYVDMESKYARELADYLGAVSSEFGKRFR